MSSEINRRPLLKSMVLGGAALLGGAAPAPARAPHAKALDLTNKKDLSLIFRKLAYSMDDKLGFWHISGTRYGLVGTKLVPFWEMHVGRFFSTHDRGDGTYEVNQMGLTYYTDIETGAYLRQFQNPLTGKRVEIKYGTPKAARYAPPELTGPHYETIDLLANASAGSRKPELAPIGTAGPAWVQGDNVWIKQDHQLQYQSPRNPSVTAHVNDLTTYFGQLSEVANPAVKSARAGQSFSDVIDWPSWLEMGDQPGAYYSHCVGFKAFSFEEMPTAWKTLARQEHPAIARDPLAALQAS